MFIAALFIIARPWKQPRCPSADEWIGKLWYIYTMEYYSAIKKNTFESVLMRWMKLEPIIQSEVSQKEKHQYSMLVGCSPWGRWESDMTERLHFHFSLSCTGEGDGNPLQCSCLENPRDGEPGGQPFMGSHRVEHDWSDLAIATHIYGI